MVTRQVKSDILRAAEQAMLEMGAQGLRVVRVAAAARVNKRMIYHYFGNRAGLVAAVVRAQIAVVRAAPGLNEATRELLQMLSPSRASSESTPPSSAPSAPPTAKASAPGSSVAAAQLTRAVRILLPELVRRGPSVPAAVAASGVPVAVDLMRLVLPGLIALPWSEPARPQGGKASQRSDEVKPVYRLHSVSRPAAPAATDP